MLVCASPGLLFLLCWSLSKVNWAPNQTKREMPSKPLTGLAEEEKKVLQLLSEGLNNLEIADRLGISAVQASLTTSYLLKIFVVTSREELINEAMQKGYLLPNSTAQPHLQRSAG